MSASNDVLIVAPSVAKRLPGTVHELLGAGLCVSQQKGGRVVAALLGDATAELAEELIARGVDRVHSISGAQLTEGVVEAHLPAMLEVCRQVKPQLVLLAHDPIGAELAPRLAFRLDGAVASGCIDVSCAEGRIRCTRPCYGGIARAVDAFSLTPVVATIRAGVFEPAPRQSGRQGEIVTVVADSEPTTRTRVLERKLEAAEGVRLEDARVIVAGGRGLEGPEGFRVLEELARALNAAVGASRVPCDLGWCPHSWQIGLTGKTVTPELYIAVGISGAGHHMAGCGNAKAIVAINIDPEAAIFQDARFGAVGDYREIVPALAAEVRKLKQAT
jgi:electron transfer flavoprotein alpha subunit